MSLLEVLVGLAVTSLMLAWLLPGATQAIQRQRHAADLSKAVRLAHAQIEALSVWPARVPMPSRGRQDGFDWQVEQTAIERPERAQPTDAALLTFRVTVRNPNSQRTLVDMTVTRLGRGS